MRKERVLLRSFGEKLKILRKRKHLTQKDFADNLNIGIDTVKNWEQGYNYPTIDTLRTIADFFKCDFDYLLGDQETPNKIYKHFSEYTGLSEEELQRLLYFCKHTSVISDLLGEIEFLMSIDDLSNTNYSDMDIKIIEDGELAKLNERILYQADKLDLYNDLINLINKSRQKKGLETI